MPNTDHTILKVLVGSQAHGLATEDSDLDYRSVFVIPTAHMFRLGFTFPSSRWSKANGDETAWEVGQFLHLGLQCHPLILETLLAPLITADAWGQELRNLFPHLWTPEKAFEAFTNYAHNQRRKFLDKKDHRPAKYAAAYIRVLHNLCELLEEGTFQVQIAETPMGDQLQRIKRGKMRVGAIIDLGEELTNRAQTALQKCTHKGNEEPLNQFFLKIRLAFLTS